MASNNAYGFGFCPTENEIVQLLQSKERDHHFNHPCIKELGLYEHKPQLLYEEGILSGNSSRWFFTNEENRNRSRQILNKRGWTMEGQFKYIGNKLAKETSFYYKIQNRRQWHMKEYKLELPNGVAKWALCVVYV